MTRLVAALLVLAAACSGEDIRDVGTTDAGRKPDAGTVVDAGTPVDAGTTTDAGTEVDAGTTPGLVVTPVLPDGPRRGPIHFVFKLTNATDATPDDFVLEVWNEDAFDPAAVLTKQVSPSQIDVVWQSFTDVQVDGLIKLRITVPDTGGDVVLPFTQEVRNALDTDRLIIVGHNLIDAAGGGATPTNDDASVLLWNGLSPGLIGSPRKIKVGKGPEDVRPAPHGRASAVVNDSGNSVSVVHTPLDALVANVTVDAPLTIPHGSVMDAHWSGDGRFLYVLGTQDGALPGAIWRFTPAENLSSFSAPLAVAALPGVPMKFDVDQKSGAFIVFCGSGGSGKEHMIVLRGDGTEAARVDDDLTPPNALRIGPAGNFALFTTDSFSGEQVRIFDLGARTISQRPTITNIGAPDDVVFHPGSTAASTAGIIANAQKNTVTPFLVTPTGLVKKTAVTGIPLATEMDLIERGPETGTVLVNAVSKIVRVKLAVDATASNAGTLYEFGAGTTNIVSGIGIQR